MALCGCMEVWGEDWSLSFLKISLLRYYKSHTIQLPIESIQMHGSLVYRQSCVTITTVNFRTFYQPRKKTHVR